MASQRDGVEKRRAYAKPRLERVRLVPRESVLAACKGDSQNAAIGNSGTGCAAPTSCLADGAS